MLHRLQGNISGGLGKMMVWYDWDELTAWGSDSISGYPDIRTGVNTVLENDDQGISGNVRDGYHPVFRYLR